MTQQNLYAINSDKFKDETLYVQYSYRTKKISIMTNNGVIKNRACITFDFLKNAITDGSWKLITHKEAKQLLNDATNKITYYKHINDKLSSFYYITYNHNAKQTLCYNKPQCYNKSIADISGAYCLAVIEKMVSNGYWVQITKDEALNLSNPKPTEPIITYYKHKSENDWYITYNNVTKETYVHRNIDPKCDDMTKTWPIDRIQRFIHNRDWVQITKDEALNLINPKTIKQSKSYYKHSKDKGWFGSYDPVTKKTTIYNIHNCSPDDMTTAWPIKAINEFVKAGKWIEINREQALSLLNI